MRVNFTLPPLWSFLGQQPAHEQRGLGVGNTDMSPPISERKDSDRRHGVIAEPVNGSQEPEDSCKGFADVENLLFQPLAVLLKLVDVVKALAQFHSLSRRNSAVHSGLNRRKRGFAAYVHELCKSKCSPGYARMYSVMERADLPKASESTSSNFRLDTVRQFCARFFSPVSIFVSLTR